MATAGSPALSPPFPDFAVEWAGLLLDTPLYSNFEARRAWLVEAPPLIDLLWPAGRGAADESPAPLLELCCREGVVSLSGVHRFIIKGDGI